MRLTDEQTNEYDNNGFLLLPEVFSRREVDLLRAELPTTFAEDSPRRVVERGGRIARSVYGSHATNEVFNRLTRHPRILEPAKQILGNDVYVYQFKINAKAAFGGDVWEWHQDYIFWNREDGMPTSKVTSVVIFLDEANEFNGPLLCIPSSHKEGVIDVPPSEALHGVDARHEETYRNSPAWISNLTADLKYSVNREVITRMVSQYGIVALKGPAGSSLFFHGNLVHASANNISPFDRVVVIITYNSVENIPPEIERPRPDFLAGRDCRPLTPLSEEALFLVSHLTQGS